MYYSLLLLIAPAYYLATYYLLCGAVAMWCAVWCGAVWCFLTLRDQSTVICQEQPRSTPTPLIFFTNPPLSFPTPLSLGTPQPGAHHRRLPDTSQLDTITRALESLAGAD